MGKHEIESLRKIQLFFSLSDEELRLVSDKLILKRFRKNEIILQDMYFSVSLPFINYPRYRLSCHTCHLRYFLMGKFNIQCYPFRSLFAVFL